MYEHVTEGFTGPEETAILNAVANEIELNSDEVEGIVTLTLPRNGVTRDTPREILQNLDPKVVLKHFCKDK